MGHKYNYGSSVRLPCHSVGVEHCSYTEYVAHCVVAVGIVHDSTCLSIHHEVLQTSACRVIAVEGLRSVAILQIGALLKLVITYLVHIIVAIGLVTTDVVYLSTEVVAVGYFLLIGGKSFPIGGYGCHTSIVLRRLPQPD